MKPKIINPDPQMPVVASVPHSSSFIPENVRDQFLISDVELREENRKLVDWFCDDLYSPIVDLGGSLLAFGASRFVCDPERFEDDSKECMFAQGMGVVYSHGTARQPIRRALSHEERETLLSEWYRPYHAALLEQVSKVVDKFGRCVFIDCHSYQEKALPYELDPEADRADFVFGDDPSHTPQGLIESARQVVEAAGYSFGLNRPFAGTVVPLGLYGDSRVISFMIEINRKTYMDEQSTSRNEGFEATQRVIGALVQRVLAGAW